METPNHQLMMI